ncbi:MAG: hypothetical protein HC875_41845, partial [Anaerolineales bacterium]|nr:hypothetical protein [Anaerolineales bacterium]
MKPIQKMLDIFLKFSQYFYEVLEFQILSSIKKFKSFNDEQTFKNIRYKVYKIALVSISVVITISLFGGYGVDLLTAKEVEIQDEQQAPPAHFIPAITETLY